MRSRPPSPNPFLSKPRVASGVKDTLHSIEQRDVVISSRASEQQFGDKVINGIDGALHYEVTDVREVSDDLSGLLPVAVHSDPHAQCKSMNELLRNHRGCICTQVEERPIESTVRKVPVVFNARDNPRSGIFELRHGHSL